MNGKTCFLIVIILCLTLQTEAQIDSILSRIKYEMDFRFRAEQDWDSRKSDGTFRDDRSRLRYRFRTGASYSKDWYTVGFRIRTGEQRKQQDPQLTLGTGPKEFGTLPLGFEKIYFQANLNNTSFWMGKNTFPFQKSNELFWSDNVFVDGVAFNQNIKTGSKFLEKLELKAGHFVLISNGRSLLDDAYLQGVQTVARFSNNTVSVFPGLFLLRNIPNIPDGDHSFFQDYTIFHLGTKTRLLQSKPLSLEVDFYYNLEDYDANPDIASDFKEEKTGLVAGIKYGTLKKDKSWMFKLTYAYLQRYSILDFMSQNDWARWDYSANNSPDGRLSNYQGTRWQVAYALSKKVNLQVIYYHVNQLIPLGNELETNQRVRFDINLKL